jgi:hypothetical protein
MTIATYVTANSVSVGGGGSVSVGAYIDETLKLSATLGQTTVTIKQNMTTGRVFHVFLNSLQSETINIQATPNALNGNVLTVAPFLDAGQCWVIAYT